MPVNTAERRNQETGGKSRPRQMEMVGKLSTMRHSRRRDSPMDALYCYVERTLDTFNKIAASAWLSNLCRTP
jgi:hypothetical protein